MAEQLANFGVTTLAEDLDASETTVTVTSGAALPSSGTFRMLCEAEIMLVTARSTNDLTVTRGAEGTTAATHANGTEIRFILTASSLADAIAQNSAGRGTSFPASPATGQPFFRTDLNLGFFYDGTRWVTQEIFHHSSGEAMPLNSYSRYFAFDARGLGVYLIDYTGIFFGSGFGGTPSTKYYLASLYRIVSPETYTHVINTSNQNIAAEASWQRNVTAIDVALSAASDIEGVRHDFSKVGGPNQGYVTAILSYRLIAT